jgi:hypothetical protein
MEPDNPSAGSTANISRVSDKGARRAVFAHFPPDLIVPIPTLETTHMEPNTNDKITIGPRLRAELWHEIMTIFPRAMLR